MKSARFMGWAGFYPHPPQVIVHLTTTWCLQIREGGGNPWGYLCLHENYDKNLSLRVFILLLKKELGQYSPLLVCSGLHKLIPVFFWGERNFSDKKVIDVFTFFIIFKEKAVPQRFIKPKFNGMSCSLFYSVDLRREQPGFFFDNEKQSFKH